MERIGILKKLKEDLEKEEKMSMNPMYNMELHELLNTPNGDFIIRVPGGWIYTTRWGANVYNSTFVPYSAEFLVDFN